MNRILLACVAALLVWVGKAPAQDQIPGKVQVAFNRYYDVDELHATVRAIAAAYPDLVEVRVIGRSRQGRELLVAVVNVPGTGPEGSKPAMWIDGNIHGNEVQASEVVLYTLWYLTKAYGRNEDLTALMDRSTFYLMPSVNPDGRAYWFSGAHTSSSSRSSQRPVDNDRDGLVDEDAPDDLDGDGSITQMWKEDPEGRWERDRHDPRIFRRVASDQKGAWTLLGDEGLDNDRDGRFNEDPPGGDDMNRNWPSGWLPDYVQSGAGPYPFESPETAAIGAFIGSRPHIAAVQSYHNAGGMILRGPGASFRESFYPGPDAAVYDEIARVGAEMLPYYRSMVIYRDLYTVHGGFVNWTAEGLGIVSFTNELWTNARFFQRDVADPSEEQDWIWRDKIAFGQVFTDYKPFDHPDHGPVLVGGLNRWSSRATPTFMLEEECHRNFAFTMLHAGEMPSIRFDAATVARVEGGLWSITIPVSNDRLIPTRLAVAAQRRIGRNDLLTASGDGVTIVAAGRVDDRRDRWMDAVAREPARVQVPEGIPSRGSRFFRFIVSGPEGATVSFSYEAEKATPAQAAVVLAETPPGP